MRISLSSGLFLLSLGMLFVPVLVVRAVRLIFVHPGADCTIQFDTLAVAEAEALLVAAMISVAIGCEESGNEFATMALFLLVLGLFLRIVCDFRGCAGRKGRQDVESEGGLEDSRDGHDEA